MARKHIYTPSKAEEKAAAKQALEAMILRIAQKHFHVVTLEERHSDRLDFHEVSVWAIKDALMEMYEAGVGSAKSMPWCEACESYHHATALGCFKGTERDKTKLYAFNSQGERVRVTIPEDDKPEVVIARRNGTAGWLATWPNGSIVNGSAAAIRRLASPLYEIEWREGVGQ